MKLEPSVIVFDVNETLSDMSPMGNRFMEVGAPEHLAKLWFASLLRDGFALTATGDNPRFAEVGAAALRTVLYAEPLNRNLDEAVEHVMAGMADLSLHQDVTAGVRALTAAGHRLITLTNGATQMAENLFAAAGIRDEFERLLSVEDAPAWKPAGGAYEYAADVCGVAPAEMLLVAVHPWDIHGASRAGLSTAWLNRARGPYSEYFASPDVTIENLRDLAGALSAGADRLPR